MHKLHFAEIALIVLCVVFGTVNGSRAAFGEFCDKSVRCDSLASLACHNGSCACLKPDSMTFDHTQRICVALAGEKCKFTVVEEYRSWLEEVNCIKNSKCLPLSGVCTCESSFTEVSNGSCVPKRFFGQFCNHTAQCRVDLKCEGGQCKCDPETSIYDFGQKQCVGLADKPCLNDLCTTNAMCRGYYGGHSTASYEEYSGEDTKCACSPGYTVSLDGLCQVGHRGLCDLETQCLDKFKCQDGVCTCIFQGHQVYDEMYQDCYSLVGGPCTPPKNVSSTKHPLYCVKPAICLPHGSYRHECSCPDGMVENSERRCELSHGRICPTERSTINNGFKCDSLAPLFCIQGKCQCEDEFKIYDPDMKKCRGLVGSNCNRTSLADVNFCVDGAYCHPFRGSADNGRCECSKYFIERQNRTCAIGGTKTNTII